MTAPLEPVVTVSIGFWPWGAGRSWWGALSTRCPLREAGHHSGCVMTTLDSGGSAGVLELDLPSLLSHLPQTGLLAPELLAPLRSESLLH